MNLAYLSMVIMQAYFPCKKIWGINHLKLKFKFCGKMDLLSPQTYKLCYIQCFFTLQNHEKLIDF